MIPVLFSRILAFFASIVGFGAGFLVAKFCIEEKREVQQVVSFFLELFFALFFAVLSYFVFKSIFARIVYAFLSVAMSLLILSSKKTLVGSLFACALSLAVFFIFGNDNAFFLLSAAAFLFFLLAGSEFFFLHHAKVFRKKE